MSELVQQIGRCDCVVAAVAMYCGIEYEAVWERLTRRERWMMSYGAPLGYRPAWRVIYELTGHQMLYYDVDGRRVNFEQQAAPMLLTVTSRNFADLVHAVYWDGRRLFDPAPDNPRGPEWPAEDIRGVEAPAHLCADLPGAFDWQAYFDDLPPMDMAQSRGRHMAVGLLPWFWQGA